MALSPKPNAYSQAKRLQLEQEAERLQHSRAQRILADNSRLVELAQEKAKRQQRLLREVLPRPTHSSLCQRRRAKRTVSESEALGSPLAVRTVDRVARKSGSPFKEVEARSNVYEAELLKELGELESSEEMDGFVGFKGKIGEDRANAPRKSASLRPGPSHYSPSPFHIHKTNQSPNRLVLSPQSLPPNKGESQLPPTLKALNRSGQAISITVRDRRQERLEKSIHDLNLKLEKLKTSRVKRCQGPRIRHVSLPGMELPAARKRLAL